MKIVLDARWIFRELSGIGLYTRELIRNLVLVDSKNDYFLIFDSRELERRERIETGFGDAKNFHSRQVGAGVFSPRSQLLLPQLLWRLRADVFHSPNYMIPYGAFPRRKRGGTACVTTIHDLIPLLFPHYTPRALKTRFFPVFKYVMRQSALRSDAVIAPSESTRRDILNHLYRGGAGNVAVVHQGVNPDYRPPASSGGGDGDTILYVGRFDPYKNLAVLIEAFALLRSRGSRARLRIVGSDDARYPEARAKAHAAGVSDQIDWSGYVDGEGLLRAYQQADLFVLPSRYEGFGLTVLEAMACGTPVVCGNRSSLPEVVGDAALTVDPDDVEALAGAMGLVLGSAEKSREMSAKGLKRAEQFTWRRTAEGTLAVYESLARAQGKGAGQRG